LADTPFKIGVVGLPGGWSSEALADAFADRTGSRLLIDIDKVVVELDRRTVLFGNVNLCELDALVVKKVGESYGPTMLDRLEILRVVEGAGVPVFSKPSSISRLIDRLACTVTLHQVGIPMPPTVVTEDPERAAEAVHRFGGAVLKPLYSTKGRGMALVAPSDPDVLAQVRAFQERGNPVMYVQQRLDVPERDYGLVFMGGRYVGAYARIRGEGSWNTTIYSGGRYALHEPTPEIIEMAHRAQAPFDLDFTSVDVVETREYGAQIFEVSAFGGFRGLKEGLGIDPAKRYVDYVLDRLRT
jgi:ribosomal protein S6--L-glutamate ligase